MTTLPIVGDSTDLTPQALASVFKALGDPTRLRIFEFLCARCGEVAMEESGEVRAVQTQSEGVTVGQVCCHVTGDEKFSSTISFHLKELRLAGLIRCEKQGKFMICSVNRDRVTMLQNYFEGRFTCTGPNCSGPDCEEGC